MLTVPKKLKTASKLKTMSVAPRRAEERIIANLLDDEDCLNDFQSIFSAEQFSHCCGILEVQCSSFLEYAENYPEVAVEIAAALMGLNPKYLSDRPDDGTAAIHLTDTKRHPVLEALADTIELGKNPKSGNPLYLWIIRACDIEELRERFKDYGKVSKKKA